MRYTLPKDLKSFGKKITSQTDEDGIIETIFSHIPPRSRHFVEFGVGPHWLDKTYEHGLEANCVQLLKNGWNGLLMDGGDHPAVYGVKKEFIKATEINSLFRKHKVPDYVDLISIDIDGQDLWVFMALNYKPILYILEYNPNFFQLSQKVTVPFDESFAWDISKYYGASLGALNKIAEDKGYKLVYANGVNAFYVNLDFLENPHDFVNEELNYALDQHLADHLQRRWEKI
jgi:hypothetical protein